MNDEEAQRVIGMNPRHRAQRATPYTLNSGDTIPNS